MTTVSSPTTSVPVRAATAKKAGKKRARKPTTAKRPVNAKAPKQPVKTLAFTGLPRALAGLGALLVLMALLLTRRDAVKARRRRRA